MTDRIDEGESPDDMDPESRAIINAFVSGRIPIDRYGDLFGQVLDDAKRYVDGLGSSPSPS